MGKAYSEEEKVEIKKRLWEEGIKLFHEAAEKLRKLINLQICRTVL